MDDAFLAEVETEMAVMCSTTASRYLHEGLQLSHAELARTKFGERHRVLRSGKLVLVLDLDHTLLNSAKFSELSAAQYNQLLAASTRDKSLHCMQKLAMFTKLRPHAHEFLAAASQLCQLYVYTMGSKNYALEMAALLDPTGQLFNGRVIGNSDSTSARTKNLDIVLSAESEVLIVDDTDRVWPHHLANLIRIDRYHFFPGSAAEFRQAGRSVMERDWLDEGKNEDRMQLRDVLTVVAAAHTLFFAGTNGIPPLAQQGPLQERGPLVVSTDEVMRVLEPRDVRRLLTRPAGGPLVGTRLAFSRVLEMGAPRPERHPLWLLATALGADVSTGVHASTTHVVVHVEPGMRYTDKMKWAVQYGAHVVTVDWLVACARHWTRLPPFMV